MSAEMLSDLKVTLDKAIESTLEPLAAHREMILKAIEDNKQEQREVEARYKQEQRDLEMQLERVDRMIEASKPRKRAGRPPGAKRRQPAAAEREAIPA